MKIVLAYIDEPPFGWRAADGRATGADVELAGVVLRAIGVTHIEPRLTTFAELLPGVQGGQWDINVPLFVTPQRGARVDFSVPVWAIGDGFLVQAGNPKALDSYAALAAQHDARLGVIAGQVQVLSAQAGGVRDVQIVQFDEQVQALDALVAGQIDAYASTALGNRMVAQRIGAAQVQAVAHRAPGALPVGAFSFRKGNRALVEAVNRQLRAYLGSDDHRRRMAAFGLGDSEIDPVAQG